MPLYEYRCDTCRETFEKFVPMAEYLLSQTCSCGGSGRKLLSTFAAVGTTRVNSLDDLRAPLGRSFSSTREVDKFLKEKGLARVDEVRKPVKSKKSEDQFKQQVSERLASYGV